MGDGLPVRADRKNLLAPLRFGLSLQQISPHQGRCHTLGVVDVVVAKASLDAQVAVIDRRVEGRGDPVNKIVLDVQLAACIPPRNRGRWWGRRGPRLTRFGSS